MNLESEKLYYEPLDADPAHKGKKSRCLSDLRIARLQRLSSQPSKLSPIVQNTFKGLYFLFKGVFRGSYWLTRQGLALIALICLAVEHQLYKLAYK